MRLYFNEIAVSCRAPNVVSRQMARIDGHTGLACAALIVLLAVLSLTSVDHDLALAIRQGSREPDHAGGDVEDSIRRFALAQQN